MRLNLRVRAALLLTFGAALSGVPSAHADCPMISIDTIGQFVVPEGCPVMIVKMWGNGGNAGLYSGGTYTGRGGGGAALTAVYQVSGGERFHAVVRPNNGNNAGRSGFATTLTDISTNPNNTVPLLIAGAGGGGGTLVDPGGTRPDGGAGGGLTGQQGVSTTHPVLGFPVGGGGGGSQQRGGRGGVGHPVDHPNAIGQPGAAFPCHITPDPGQPFCGGPESWNGTGGQGHFAGGGGGGSMEVNAFAGGGGGGGSSRVVNDPRLLYVRRYSGNYEIPGNAQDPHRNGAGAGGIIPAVPWPAEGATGRIVVLFDGLRIVPEETTRWKPMRSDTPMDIVFDSPIELKSGRLEITNGDIQISVTDQNLQQLPSTSAYRYKLSWVGPWTYPNEERQLERLPPGDYSVIVHGKPMEGDWEMASPAYESVSLVEVTSVAFESVSPESPLDTNPGLPPLPVQSPSQGRSYLDSTGAFNGGKRIFAEARLAGGPAFRTVNVRIETFPPIADLPTAAGLLTVHVRSFDVDDPAFSWPAQPNRADLDLDTGPVADNRGVPSPCGLLASSTCGVQLQLASGENTLSVTFRVSGQPGDNYRVAASTDQAWLDGLVAVQPSHFGEIRTGSGGATPLDEAGKNAVSEMLTVWRTVHFEVDGTHLAPTGPTDAERNFLRGRVSEIDDTGSSLPFKLVLLPDVTVPPLGLDDLSPNFSDGMGSGRFEKGLVMIGSGAGTLTFRNLEGNGDSWIERSAGFSIPFQLTASGGGNPLTGLVRRWSSATRLFELSVPASAAYVGGQIAVAGESWTVEEVLGSAVRVASTAGPSFVLLDDDDVAPFGPTSAYLTAGSDAPTTNVLAQAYVRVAYDLPNHVQRAAFRRNTPFDMNVIRAQVQAGRDSTTAHSMNYWAGYVQGAFQGPEYYDSPSVGPQTDSDPFEEALYSVPLAFTPTVVTGGTGDLRLGSVVYLEAVRETQGCSFNAALNFTVAHEIGHQFHLHHPQPPPAPGVLSEGIMTTNSACLPAIFFTDANLSTIRSTIAQ